MRRDEEIDPDELGERVGYRFTQLRRAPVAHGLRTLGVEAILELRRSRKTFREIAEVAGISAARIRQIVVRESAKNGEAGGAPKRVGRSKGKRQRPELVDLPTAGFRFVERTYSDRRWRDVDSKAGKAAAAESMTMSTLASADAKEPQHDRWLRRLERGRRLSAAFEMAGITDPSQLAVLAGVTRDTAAGWLDGMRWPPPRYVERIVQLLGLSKEELLFGPARWDQRSRA